MSVADASLSPPLSKGEATRLAILDAAIERFGRDGFRGTSVADIARDAGVSGTAAYAYFDNKEDLFLSALDEDAAALINSGMEQVLAMPVESRWRENLIFIFVAEVHQHPLAKRVLSNLEPDVIDRVVDLPALQELRKVVAARLEEEQETGTVRTDIDPVVVGSGLVSIVLSLLMTVVQLGDHVPADHAADVVAVFEAAIERRPPTD